MHSPQGNGAHRDCKRNRQQAKKQFDNTAQEPKFEEIQWVSRLFRGKREKCPKLQIGWEEKPYQILQGINEVLVKIQRQGSPKKRAAHVNRMRKVKDPTRIVTVDSSSRRKE